MTGLRLLLLTTLLLAGCRDSARLGSLPPGSTVLAFGNSITFGSGARPGEDYPTRLAAISGWQIHDPIHPNATGYRKFAEGLAEQLSRAGLLKRP